MNIKVLGPGCAKCQQLEKTVKDVVKELAIHASVDVVKDPKEFLKYNVLMTPGLVINGQTVSSGKALSKGEVTQLIINALDREQSGKS